MSETDFSSSWSTTAASDSDAGTESDGNRPEEAVRWQQLFDALNDAVWVLDADHRILQCNRSSCEMFHRTHAQLLGKHCYEIVHGTTQPIPECPVPRMYASRHRESMELAVGNRWYHVTVDPLNLRDGEPPGAVHILRDITERKQTEQALRKLNDELEHRVEERTASLRDSEAKYRALIENTLDIPFSTDGDGVIRYVGPQARLYAFDPGMLVGRHFLDFVFPADRAAMTANFERTLAEGQTRPSQFRVRTPADVVRWFEERSTIQRDNDGTITGFTGVLRDITAAQEAEELRAEHERKLQRLAARLATAQDEEQRRLAEGLHDDVAQLLTACSIKLAIARGCADPHKTTRVHKEIEALLRESNDKLRLLSFELASSTLYRLGLREAVSELCDGMEERYDIRFTVTGERHIEGLDEARATVLFKAVRELLFNVVKHAGAKEATVEITRTDGTIALAVVDNGQGLPACITTDKVGIGTGLGLFGIRERLADLGGRMKIQSTPHRGTRVTLWMPATNAREPTDPVRADTTTPNLSTP